METSATGEGARATIEWMCADKDPLGNARNEATKIGVGSFERHVFLCVGPDCCSSKQGATAWSRLKKAVADLNKREGAPRINRSKVGCLRICEQGPVAVIYPEGTWYGGLMPSQLDRVIEEDLGQGNVVDDLVIGKNPLG